MVEWQEPTFVFPEGSFPFQSFHRRVKHRVRLPEDIFRQCFHLHVRRHSHAIIRLTGRPELRGLAKHESQLRVRELVLWARDARKSFLDATKQEKRRLVA